MGAVNLTLNSLEMTKILFVFFECFKNIKTELSVCLEYMICYQPLKIRKIQIKSVIIYYIDTDRLYGNTVTLSEYYI